MKQWQHSKARTHVDNVGNSWHSCFMRAQSYDGYRRNVATLAESPAATTCSALVARRFRLGIVPSGSFEEAIALVKAGVAQAALVPGAYPGINAFFQDPELRLVRCFAADIPALVLAAKPKGRPPFRQVFAHPATKPYWPHIDAPIVEAGSNDMAAAAVDSKRVACITNAAAAKHAGLRILREFRPASPMGWNLFARAEKCEATVCNPTSSAPPLELQPTT